MTDARLHIERLVVDGLPWVRGQEAALQGAVTAELTRLLREEGPPAALDTAGSAGRRGVAPTLRVPPGGDVTGLGADLARTVYRSLGGTAAAGGSCATVPGPCAPAPEPGPR
jgi:hypothetical protein